MIKRLAAEGVPKARIAERLGISRTTVVKAVQSESPPHYERRPRATTFTSFDARVRVLLEDDPELPAVVIAERVGWTGSLTWFRQNVKRLRPEHRKIDPADRLVWEPGDAAQCDLWFPPKPGSSLWTLQGLLSRFPAAGTGQQQRRTERGPDLGSVGLGPP